MPPARAGTARPRWGGGGGASPGLTADGDDTWRHPGARRTTWRCTVAPSSRGAWQLRNGDWSGRDMAAMGAVSFSEAQDLVVGCFFDPIEVKKWLNVGTECCLRKAIIDIHAFAMDIVCARRQSSSVQDRDDVLSRFVASDEHNDEVLRDIVLSFLIAGRETTSSGLSWFFWLLSSQPDVMACITNEVRAVRKATDTCPDEPFGFDALRETYG
uniref:Cytochrome P450 n=1 Tax=Oryza nivara TaxID=4536 RepID=A0A0E0GXE3_ORYNI